jgi:hypothetical protein
LLALQAFARSVSQRVGGFEVPNPGGPRPLPKPLSAPPPAAGPAAAPASTMPRPPLSAHVPPQRPAAAAPKPPARPQGGGGGKRSFAETFAGVTAGQDADRGSRHQDLALEEEERRTFAALDVLAKREGLHDAASKLTKMSARAPRQLLRLVYVLASNPGATSSCAGEGVQVLLWQPD